MFQARFPSSNLTVLLVVVLLACTSPSETAEPLSQTLFALVSASDSGIDFRNDAPESKDYNIFTYRNFYNGGGVAIGDINNDGLADIYFTANLKENKLYLNKGDFKFVDITTTSHTAGAKSWSTGATMVDVNNDGFLDIYVCNSGDVAGGSRENELFINNGDLTFTEKASEYGLDDKGFSTHASFFDYDLDGDLDCYLLNNSFKKIDKVDQFYVKRDIRDEAGGDKLLRNDNGRFVDVSVQANIYGSEIGFGLGISVSDLNGDMLPDMYVSNDFWERDYMYINKGNGTFTEDIIGRTGIISASSMGSDVADLDNDGDVEIFTTEMLPADNFRLKDMARFDETNIKELKIRSSYHYQQMQNCIQWNYGDGTFQELAHLLNVADTDWSWGSLLFDMNNDGRKDIFVANGIYRDITSMDFADFVGDRENIKQILQTKGRFEWNDLLDLIPSTKIENYAFINEGNKRFTSSALRLGLGQPSFSNGASYADLDNDGDMDLVVNNLNMESFVYRNNSSEETGHNYLRIVFKGNEKNHFGIGARVDVFAGGELQTHQNYTSRGFESSVEPKLLFGLAKAKKVDSVYVIWPDLRMQKLYNVGVNTTLEVKHADATMKFSKPAITQNTLLTDITTQVFTTAPLHVESGFNDFDRERLLPRRFSTEGPVITSGDVNKDGREDLFVGGAFGFSDRIYFQQLDGKFKESTHQSMLRDSTFESTCSAFLDADSDGDIDLVVGSGGNEPERSEASYQLRLYANDGKGNLVRTEFMPSVRGNFSCIAVADYDGDGDQDMFIGARIVPGNYGTAPESYLLKNNGATWEVVTPDYLKKAGMISAAVWADVDHDGLKDLVVAGDWMPVTVFRNNGKTLEQGEKIQGSAGWWNSLGIADLNGDGSDDIVAGNWGVNSRYKATQKRPMQMYLNDFDKNGKTEFVITSFPTLDSSAYPFATKQDLVSQMPALKKKALRYGDYARMSYEELFSEEQRKDAVSFRIETLQSSVFINDGKGNFRMQALPVEAQVSPVMAIVTEDFDLDGKVDLLLCGNFSGVKHELSRQDGNRGVFLKGKGDGTFTYEEPSTSGIFIKGEVRDVAPVIIRGHKSIIVGRNNDKLVAYKLKTGK